MTEDTKLILEIIVPIIILLIMFCVMCWNKALTEPTGKPMGFY